MPDDTLKILVGRLVDAGADKDKIVAFVKAWDEAHPPPTHEPGSGNPVLDMARGVGEQAVGAVLGTGQAILHPLDTAEAILTAQGDQLHKAGDELSQGHYGEAARRGLAGLTPVIGPAAAAISDRAEQGDESPAQATGEMLGLMATSVLPTKMGRRTAAPVIRMAARPVARLGATVADAVASPKTALKLVAKGLRQYADSPSPDAPPPLPPELAKLNLSPEQLASVQAQLARGGTPPVKTTGPVPPVRPAVPPPPAVERFAADVPPETLVNTPAPAGAVRIAPEKVRVVDIASASPQTRAIQSPHLTLDDVDFLSKKYNGGKPLPEGITLTALPKDVAADLLLDRKMRQMRVYYENAKRVKAAREGGEQEP